MHSLLKFITFCILITNLVVLSEILIGHSSHLLLAGADASQQAYEDPVSGGRFTQTLLEVLRDAGREGGDLQTMTYKELVKRIQDRFDQIEADPKNKLSL